MPTDSSAAAKNGKPTVFKLVPTVCRHGAGIVASMHRFAGFGEKRRKTEKHIGLYNIVESGILWRPHLRNVVSQRQRTPNLDQGSWATFGGGVCLRVRQS